MYGPESSDLGLARLIVRDNDPEAALTLFNRYERLVSRLASRYSDGTAYDANDARQDCFLALYDAAAKLVEDPGHSFAHHFRSKASKFLRVESSRMGPSLATPYIQIERVAAAVRQLGSATLAREWLATDAPAHMRVSRESFDQIWYVSFGKHVEWNDPAARDMEGGTLTAEATVADRSVDRSFQSVEDREAVGRLIMTLPLQWQEVLVRLYGLDGYGEHTSQAVAAVLGLHEVSVRKIHSKALARLQMNSDLPTHYTPVDLSKRNRIASTVGGNRQDSPAYDFPVSVRSVA